MALSVVDYRAIDLVPRRIDLGPLHLAVLDGGTEAMTRLILEGADVNEVAVCDVRDLTPLHIACLNDNRRMSKFLLDHGADPNNTGVYGEVSFVLHLTCSLGRHQIARLLLQHGADVNACDEDKSTTLHVACYAGKFLAARLLLKKCKVKIDASDLDYTPLVAACGRSHNQIALLLVAQGADVNLQHPLHSCYCPRVAKVLIDKGARVNAIDGAESNTALHEACRRGDLKVAQVLIDHKANVNAKRQVWQVAAALGCR